LNNILFHFRDWLKCLDFLCFQIISKRDILLVHGPKIIPYFLDASKPWQIFHWFARICAWKRINNIENLLKFVFILNSQATVCRMILEEHKVNFKVVWESLIWIFLCWIVLKWIPINPYDSFKFMVHHHVKNCVETFWKTREILFPSKFQELFWEANVCYNIVMQFLNTLTRL
jgi:hypothetical protein